MFASQYRLRRLRLRCRLGQRVTGTGIFRQFGLVVANAANFVMRCLERRIRDENDLHFVYRFEVLYPVALFVEQEGRDLYRQLRNDLRGALFARFLANDPEDRQSQRLHASNCANAGATRAGQVAGFAERRAQTLSRHLQQAEARNLADLDTGPILANRLP